MIAIQHWELERAQWVSDKQASSDTLNILTRQQGMLKELSFRGNAWKALTTFSKVTARNLEGFFKLIYRYKSWRHFLYSVNKCKKSILSERKNVASLLYSLFGGFFVCFSSIFSHSRVINDYWWSCGNISMPTARWQRLSQMWTDKETQLSSLLSVCVTQKCEAPHLPAYLPTSIRVIQHDYPMSNYITF